MTCKTSYVTATDNPSAAAVPEETGTSGAGHLSVAELPPAQRTGLIVGLCIGVLAVAFEMFAITAAMPTIAPQVEGMTVRYAWAFTMFVIGQAFSIIVVGRLVDRLGAFKPLAAGLVFFGIGLALAGSSSYWFTFLTARVVQGLGGGALTIAVMVVIAEVFSDTQRSMMVTIFSFCYLLPAFVGPPAAAFIAVNLGWRWVFWLIIPLLVGAAIVGYRPVHRLYRGRQIRGASQNDIPIWAALAGTGGIALLQGAGQDIAWQSIGLAVGGLVAVGIAMPRLMPHGFWRIRPGMPALMWVRLTLAGAFFASQSFMTYLLQEDRKLDAQTASWALAIGALGWVSGTLLQSRAWLRLRRDQIMVAGAAFTAFGVGLIAVFAGWHQVPIWVAGVALLLAGFGMGLGITSTNLALMTLSPPADIGRNTSSLQVSDSLGSAFFGGIAGTIMATLQEHFHTPLPKTFGWIYAVNGVVALLALFLALRMGRVRNESSGVG